MNPKPRWAAPSRALIRRALVGRALMSGAAATLALGAATVHAAESRGYVVSWFQPAMYSGDDDCPEGVQPPIDFVTLFKSQGRSDAEVKALIDNPTSPEFVKALLYRGKDGANVCANPESAPDPNLKLAQGKVAYGMDLDGSQDASVAPGTCAHTPFEGADGRKGVDNQLYRVLGCLNGHRGKRGADGFVFQYIMERMRSEGLLSYAVEITGVDDPKNDDDVTVGIYQGADPLIQNANGDVQADTTQHIGADPRWHNKVKGRIRDGVLTTDTFDLNLLGHGLWIPEFHFRNARVEMTFQPDGSFKGMVGGYLDIMPLYFNSAKSNFLFEVFNSGSCPGVWYAYKKMADGFPDPKTGECTALSSAWHIEGVPAFLVHPPAEKVAGAPAKSAAAQTGAETAAAAPRAN